jgi:L-threonylcarbamoyladenylate synthase
MNKKKIRKIENSISKNRIGIINEGILKKGVKTEIIKMHSLHGHEYAYAIEKASRLIKNGELVVFPTETVYGLGANAYDKKAVKKIYQIKNRPTDNPLIVHVSTIDMAKTLAEFNADAEILANTFWPGPLTMILPKSILIPDEVTGGLDTVAIRMPNNKIALDLIVASSVPIAAPSANLSGRPSITNGKDAYEELSNLVPLILDGGQCKIGIESTVINLTSDPITILRQGAIAKEEIEKVLNKKVKICEDESIPLSPGMKYKHYSPKANVHLVMPKDGRLKTILTMAQKASELNRENKKVMLIFSEGIPSRMISQIDEEINAKIYVFENIRDLARELFKLFRLADRKNYDSIIIEGIHSDGIGFAVMERLGKAADEIVE